MVSNPYLELTEELNRGRLRALLSSGQAVVVHRLAIMSKDGDWILREDAEALAHVLGALSRHGARYRFGAPLDLRWLAGGWSSHFESRREALRLRTDFVTRPPRITAEQLARMWEEAEATDNDVVRPEPLAAMKLTNREKDYAVVGELARLMNDPRAQLLYSRSSRDLIKLAEEHPAALAEVVRRRPILAQIAAGRDALEEALDRERRTLIHVNEQRLARYMAAADAWAKLWPEVQRRIGGLPLLEAHRLVVSSAEGVLPFHAYWRTGAVTEIRDEFLSEEDLDLRNLSQEELIAYWNLWLHQAQATNDLDEHLYSHGVFERDPTARQDDLGQKKRLDFPSDQLWFHHPEVQERVARAEAEFADGRATRTETPEEAIGFLDRLKQRSSKGR